jgi:hypothetical protein
MFATRSLKVTLLCCCLTLVSISAEATLPVSFNHATKYYNPDGSITLYAAYTEYYVRSTLPNEWFPSWSFPTLQAGAVIIRSGVYWRINRSVLGSGWPYNNCHEGYYGGQLYYSTAPRSAGGHENFIVGSALPATNDAVDTVYQFHAERVQTPAGRPDPFVGLRYNNQIQYRTRDGAVTWLDKVRYAYVGYIYPYSPNAECSQSDDQTYSDPVYRGN